MAEAIERSEPPSGDGGRPIGGASTCPPSTMNRKPAESVSVVIPTFNRAPLLRRAIRSVLAAIAPSDEIIVVDDESADLTDQVVAEFGEPVRYVRNVHRGLACGSARNRGIEEARHPLVAFLDSDDEWLPDTLALQRAFMQARPDVVFCFGDFANRWEDGHVRHFGLRGWHRDPRGWDEILAPGVPYSTVAPLPDGRADFTVHVGDMYRTLLRANYVATQSALVRRGRAGADFRFAEDVPLFEEYECFSRLARLGSAAFFNCETFVQWTHDGPRMTDLDEWRRATARLTILPRIWGLDEAFLRDHGDAFRRCLADQHLVRARVLLREGRRREAREELRRAGGVPPHYRLASTLPGPLLRGMFRIRDAVRRRPLAPGSAALTGFGIALFRRLAGGASELIPGAIEWV